MSKESSKKDHIELTISAVDGSQYRCVFHHDNPHDMTTLGNIQEWLGSPDDGGLYGFPVHEVVGPAQAWGKRTMRETRSLTMGSQVFLSRKGITSVLLDNHQNLRASSSSDDS